MNGVQTRLKCKPNVKRCKRFVFAAHSPLLHPNTLKTKAIIHFQTDHILTRFVFPPLKAKLWFLVAWGITGLLPYYYQFVSPYIWGGCAWNSFNMLYYFAGFNGYLLLGHYLRNHDWSWSKTLSVCIPMFLAGYMVTFFGFRHMTALPQCSDEMLELFFTYNSLNVIMMTIPFFLIAKKVKVRSELIQRMLANLTVCGFGIYMIHYFFTGPGVVLMRNIGVPVPLQIPAAAVVAFGVSWLLVVFIRKISGKNAKYIVG